MWQAIMTKAGEVESGQVRVASSGDLSLDRLVTNRFRFEN